MTSPIAKFGVAILTAVVLATGGAAWKANAVNEVQDVRLQALEARADRTDELIERLRETNVRIEILNERLRRLEEAL